MRQLAAPLAWSLYIVLPVAGWGWVDGVPVGPLEAAAIALVWWCWASTRQLAGGRVLIALAIAKVLLGGLLVERGFTARYYANDSWTDPVEQSVEVRRGDITRRDQRLAFGGDGQSDLPLHFLNDLRFNFYQPTEPERHRLAYSVSWDGFLDGNDPPRERTLYLVVPEGGAGSLAIDNREVLPLGGASDRTAAVTLGPGWHTLTIRIHAPYGSGRAVEAGEIGGGVRVPFDRRRVYVNPASPSRMALDAVSRWVAGSADLVVLSWLVVILVRRVIVAWRERRVGYLLWGAAVVEAVVFARPYIGRTMLLPGGEDYLLYEHLARAIAMGDPLLREPGAAAGQGTPFYFQPLYPYFVALTHLMFGDSLFGVALAQRVLLAASVAWMAAMTGRLFTPTAGSVALIGGGLFMYLKAGPWSDVVLAEPLFIPIFVGWIWMLVQVSTGTPSFARLVAAGLAGGVATLTRSTLLLAWPVLLPAWSASLRERRAQATAVLVVVMIATVGLATARNWVVARTFVPVTTSFGINLYLGNEPTRPLEPAPSGRAALYARLQLDDNTRAVAEYALQAPKEFLLNLGRKATYSVGLFERSGIRRGERGTSWMYVAVWCAAAAGIARVLRSRSGWPLAVVSLPLLAALSHFGAVVLIFPFVYGDRLILPLYPLLIPYAAFAIEPMLVFIARRAPGAGSFLLATPEVSSTTMAKARMQFSELRMPRLVPVLAVLSALALATLGGAYYFTREPAPEIRIRWRDGIDAARRAELERQFRLVRPVPFEDRLSYDLLDTSGPNVAALIDERDIQDTDRVDRENRAIPPDVPYGASWMWIAHRLPILRNPGVVEGILIACAAMLAIALGALAEGWRVRRKLSRP